MDVEVSAMVGVAMNRQQPKIIRGGRTNVLWTAAIALVLSGCVSSSTAGALPRRKELAGMKHLTTEAEAVSVVRAYLNEDEVRMARTKVLIDSKREWWRFWLKHNNGWARLASLSVLSKIVSSGCYEVLVVCDADSYARDMSIVNAAMLVYERKEPRTAYWIALH